jgi:hypothetical protein
LIFNHFTQIITRVNYLARIYLFVTLLFVILIIIRLIINLLDDEIHKLSDYLFLSFILIHNIFLIYGTFWRKIVIVKTLKFIFLVYILLSLCLIPLPFLGFKTDLDIPIVLLPAILCIFGFLFFFVFYLAISNILKTLTTFKVTV